MGWDFLGGGHYSGSVGWLQPGARIPIPVTPWGCRGTITPIKPRGLQGVDFAGKAQFSCWILVLSGRFWERPRGEGS